jgi:2-amino-4-hydroxy-6-hydroxymethyldihydropteridine diphosphokinase
MNKVFLLIGGNMGDRLQNLRQAKALLEATCGPIVQASSVYETAAWGKTDQDAFLNQALELHTHLPARDLIITILEVEEKLGRRRMEKFGPRIIDIDILFYNDAVIDEPNLSVPHPQLPYRRFALAPMNEIAPQLVHPVLHITIAQLLQECRDELEVKLVGKDGE